MGNYRKRGSNDMPGRALIFRVYIVFLLVSLMMEMNLFSIPRFSIESVSPGLFAMAMGIVFPLFFSREFLIFIKKNRFLLLICGMFLACGTISVLHSPFPITYGAKWFFQYGLNMGTSLILLFLFHLDRELGRVFLKTLVILGVFSSLVAIFETGNETLSHFLADTFRNSERQIINGRLRPGATLGHPNILGCFLSLEILICILLKERFQGKNTRFYLSVLCLSIGMALTGSRNAMLVLGIPLLLLLLNRKRIKTILFVLLINGVCLAILTPSTTRVADIWHLVAKKENRKGGDSRSNIESKAFPRPDARSLANKSDKLNSAASRPMLWESAIRMFKDHPAFGIGPGGFNLALKDYASKSLLALENYKINQHYLNAHNGFFNVLAEFGTAGVMAVGIFCVFLFLNLARRYRIRPPSAVYGVILGLFISFGPDAFFYNNFYMVLFFSLLFLLGFGREDPEPEPRQ